MMNFEFNLMIFFNFILIFIMIIPSNLYKFHPLILSMFLMFYILINVMKMNYLNSECWYSYIMFLVVIGGLMILFMYFTSLAMNQLINFNMNFFLYMILKIFLILFILYLFNKLNNFNFFLLNYTEIFSNMNLGKNCIEFKNLMMEDCLNFNLYLIIYLFFMMICVVLICTKFMLPMRQFKKMK